MTAKTTKKKRVNGNRKGKSAERVLVKAFSKWWGCEFFRTPESGGMATRLSKQLGIDFSKFKGDIVTLDETFPFCVESKKVEGWTLEQLLTSEKTLIHSWWRQAVDQTPSGKKPLLVFTKNHAPLYAMMHTWDIRHDFFVNLEHRMFSTVVNDSKVRIFPLMDMLDVPKDIWLDNEKV